MDKQLERVDAPRAAERYRQNLPVSLKQLALALGVGYEQVRLWKRQPGFPYANRLILPEDFRLWRQRRFGLTGARKTAAAVGGVAAAPEVGAGSHDARALVQGANATLPPHAARLVALAICLS